MTQSEPIELNFPLERDDDWPPFATEGLWCQPERADFLVLTCPLFVKGVAIGDRITAHLEETAALPSQREVVSFNVLEPSDHSTIWLIAIEDSLRERILAELRSLGCSTVEAPEGARGHAAIDVPGHVDMAPVDAVLDPHEQRGSVHLAFPALRHSPD